MKCPMCAARRSTRSMPYHLEHAHGWKAPGTVFGNLTYADGFWWCGTCGDPVENDEAFDAIKNGLPPVLCTNLKCGRALVRIGEG